MVKPPKSMQPESVDLSKAGRKSGRSFQMDSFHQYMARKIDLQRQQFGLKLPPPPKPTSDQEASPSTATKKRKQTPNSPDKSTLDFSPLKIEKIGGDKKPRKDMTKASKSRSVTHKDDSSMACGSVMSGILKNLQKRHGDNRHKVLQHAASRKRSRQQMTKTSRKLDFGFEESQKAAAYPQEQTSQLEASYTSSFVSESRPNHKSTPESDTEMSPSQEKKSSEFTQSATPPSLSKLKRQRPDLFFLGVVIKVQGYTDPDNETLKRMIQRHGGDFETYETTRVTHMIAEHLSTAKANYMKKQKRPRPVVSPKWIVDSIQAQRLLPHGDYLLEELKDTIYTTTSNTIHGTVRQVGIKDIFKKPSKPPPGETTTSPLSNFAAKNPRPPIALEGTVEESLDRAETCGVDDVHDSKDFSLLTQVEPSRLNEKETISDDRETSPNESSIEKTKDDKVSTGHPQLDATTKTAKSADKEITAQNQSHQAESSSPTKRLVRSGRTDGKYINGSIRTTGTDPKFLESFFSNSRLSFIGSYKQRTNEPSLGSPQKARATPAYSKKDSKRFVFHVDMDSFFANVVLRNYPEYRDKPVAISHHGKPKDADPSGQSAISKKSTSECATCNYKAREFGVKKGMFLSRARQLCPELIVLPYDFAGYEEVSEQVMTILHRVSAEYHGCVEAVSCDEAYMELYLQKTENVDSRAENIAKSIRRDIFETTQCTASIGVAANKFLAKIGTDLVKPDGSMVVDDYRNVLQNLRLRDLHGIGYRSEPKLAAEGLQSVQDVWNLGIRAQPTLERVLGPGLGKKIFAFCQGEDDREVKAAERKTIGAECNYGVRFDGPYGVEHFFSELAKEVEKRMQAVGVKGTKLTLKVKERKKGAKMPPKFLGHGSCHNHSKSMDVPNGVPTREAKIFSDMCMSLYQELAIPDEEVRGMGMVISKLCPEDVATNSDLASKKSSMMVGWLTEGNKKKEGDGLVEDLSTHFTVDSNHHQENSETTEFLADNIEEEKNEDEGRLALPPISQIHMSQVAALPDDIQAEIRARISERQIPESLDFPLESSSDEKRIPRVDNTKTASHHRTFDADRGNFRQTDVKRMMKLAAVKSGKESTVMPLSQFDHLPLELKLQIANSDYGPLGQLSQHRNSRAPILKHSSGNDQKRRSEEDEGVIDLVQQHRKEGGAAKTPLAANSPDQVIIGDDSSKSSVPATQDVAVPSRPTDMYEDDILPLQHFLQENSPSNMEAVDMVISFLGTCVSESRLTVVSTLIKCMVNRKDAWSDRQILLRIAGAVSECHQKKHGFGLDIDWMLRP